MSTEQNQTVVDAEKPTGEEGAPETVSIPKEEYEKLNQTLGSLKRQVKDLTKPKTEAETPQKTNESTEIDYSKKAFLKASGLNTADEMKLATDFAKRTGDELESVLEDDVFKARLEKLRTSKSNEVASQGSTGRGNQSSGKDSADYWLAKLGPNDEVPAELPRDLKMQIIEARRNKGKNAKVFYND